MPNKLIHEQSLYLLQHAHNPVDWYPWGDEAFDKAKAENKPVLVSIGYAACHWCHVMERESFEDTHVAAYMNEHFINIKVDREEYPDVDHLYMDALQAISGSGGWPLNVFVTPERIPFYGGTYFPPLPAYQRPSWLQLLHQIIQIWQEQPKEIEAQTTQMLQFLKNAAAYTFQPGHNQWTIEVNNTIKTQLLKQADTVYGGFGNAPKFPQTKAIQYLLEHYSYTQDEASLQQALLSLDRMASGGIYDQLGGGFARYSTDTYWLAPHFEKMLYDNALLISVYCTAYRITKQSRYQQIIEETLAFVERELKDDSGIYYSAIDADSEGIEGKFYTWSWQELKTLFTASQLEFATTYFGVKNEGNWEDTNILLHAASMEEMAEKFQLTEEEVSEKIEELKNILLQRRAQRVRPLTDDKCLLSWNALMNIAWVDASIALDKPAYLQKAIVHMDELLTNYELDEKLFRVYKDGKARIEATLEDYAFLIQSLIHLSSASGNHFYLRKATTYCTLVEADFLQENGVMFYFTSHHQTHIPVRKIELHDGAVPSSNAYMAHNLMMLGICMGNNNWIEQAHQMLQQLFLAATKHSLSFAYWCVLMQRTHYVWKITLLREDKMEVFKSKFREKICPHVLILVASPNTFEIPLLHNKDFSNGNSIFVCSEEMCYPPTNDISKAINFL